MKKSAYKLLVEILLERSVYDRRTVAYLRGENSEYLDRITGFQEECISLHKNISVLKADLREMKANEDN